MFKAINAFYLILVILSLLFFVYWPNLSGPFLLDDLINIEPLKTQDFSLEAIWHSITKDGIGPHSRLISKLSFVSTLAMHGDSSWGFKYHNLITHLLIALLLFWLSGRLLQNIFVFNKAWFIAAFATILWVIAPIHVSTVLYPVQRMAQLAALFTVTGLLGLVFSWEAIKKNQLKTAFFLCFITFPACLILASFSKPNGLLLLVFTLLLGFLLPINKNPKIINHRIFRIFLICIIAPMTLGTFYLLIHWNQLTDYSMRNFTLSDRLLTQINVVVFYIKQIYIPQLNEMTLYHDDFPITKTLDKTTIFSALTITGIIICAWLVRKKYSIITFGVFWFFTGHLLESTVFNLEMVFEHRNYLASFGLMLILAFLINKLVVSNAIKYSISILIVIIYLVLTCIRSNTWRDEEIFYRVAIHDHPQSVRAHATFASFLLRKNKFQEARQHLKKAIAIQPIEVGNFIVLYNTYCFEKKMPHELIEEAKRILSKHPISAYGITSIFTLNQQKQFNKCLNLPQNTTISLIDTAIEYKDSKINLELLYRLKAQSLILNNDFELATEYFKKSYLVKKKTEILLELLTFQISLGFYSEAHKTIENLRILDKNLRKDHYKIKYYEKLLKKAELDL